VVSKKVTNYLSFFFLLLFLFPQAEKQIHAFQHKNDTHCSTTDKHFHNPEHNCSICDFTATDSNAISENDFSFTISGSQFLYEPFIENVNSVKTFHHLPSRAPPLV
jgi:hypothetical protein